MLRRGRRLTSNADYCRASLRDAVSRKAFAAANAYKSFYNFEDGALAVARRGAGEQCANSLNSLTASANHAANIPASKLHLKDSRSATWNFRQHHVVRKFNQLTNDELEKLSHALEA